MATPKTTFTLSEEDFKALQAAIVEQAENQKKLTEEVKTLTQRVRFMESQEESNAEQSDKPKAAKASGFELGGKKYTFSDAAVAKNKVSNPANLAGGFITIDSVIDSEELQQVFAKYANENPKNQTIQAA